MRAIEELTDGTTRTVKLGQVIRTCSIGNIRMEKRGRLPREVKIMNTRYVIGCIEKDGKVIASGFIGEMLMWDTKMQPYSLDNITDTYDPTVDPFAKYKCLGRWLKSHR